MKLQQVFLFLNSLLKEKSSFRFIGGICLGLSFSMTVILVTIGLMDGFEVSLRQGLKQANGDVLIQSYDGFFELKEDLKDSLKRLEISHWTEVVQTEGFAIHQQASKGVLLKGVESLSFYNVTGLKLSPRGQKVSIGKVLAENLGLKPGDFFTLSLATTEKRFKGLPKLIEFEVGEIVHHRIYQKDLRLIYIEKAVLSELLESGVKMNLLLLRTSHLPHGAILTHREIVKVTNVVEKLREHYSFDYRIQPFWYEFSYLIEAVKVEKFMIGLVLQVIIVIALFNVVAFIVFLNERKRREVFLMRALGLARLQMTQSWMIFSLLIWGLSAALSCLEVQLFNYGLEHLPFLKLPGDVYHLAQHKVILDLTDYATVFVIGLAWISLFTWGVLIFVKRRSILYGLRREFA